MSDVAQNIQSFYGDYFKAFTVAEIIIGAIVLRIVLRFIINRLVSRIVTGAKKRQVGEAAATAHESPLSAVRIVQRTRTLGGVLNNIVVVVLVTVAVLSVITTINQDILGSFALITAALGAGLGFGAQNIIKDVLNGLFIVAEDQLGVGDVIDTGFATGVVEHVGIRVTQLRDVNGTVWFIRNGEIVRVGNMSKGWSRVIIDLTVPSNADVAAVQAQALATATALSTTSKWRPLMVERPEVWGIRSVTGDALVIRLVAKTRPGSKDAVARELLSRLKIALDELGVTLPSLASVVLSGFDEAESVSGARMPRTAAIPVVSAESVPAVIRTRKPRL